MEMAIKIQGMNISDLSEIENIGEKSLPIYYKVSDLYYLLLDKNYICLKAKLEKKIVGFIIVKYHDDLNKNHIMSISVLKKYRKKGVGSKLISALKLFSKNKCVSLYVQKCNTIAINFYVKNSFIIINEIKDYYESLENKEAIYLEFNSEHKSNNSK